jgi:clan AA aspartic protease
MGTFTVKVEIGDPQGQRWETVEALVDSGASHTLIPASILRRLGVVPEERWPFDLADGRTVECDTAETYIKIDGRRRHTVIVFGEETARPLLGAVTLEEFRLGIDPLRRQLIPIRGLLTKLVLNPSQP